MKLTTVLLAFIPAILAQPLQQRDGGLVVITLSNGKTSAISTLPADGKSYDLDKYFGATNFLAKNATSSRKDPYHCIFKGSDKKTYAEINASKKTASFSARHIKGDTLQCQGD